jgi:hypothetical protein
MSHGARNWPFFTFPVAAAASSCPSAGRGRRGLERRRPRRPRPRRAYGSRSAQGSRRARAPARIGPVSIPAPEGLAARTVRLVVGGLVDEPHPARRPRRQCAARDAGRGQTLDDAGPGDQDEAGPPRRRPSQTASTAAWSAPFRAGRASPGRAASRHARRRLALPRGAADPPVGRAPTRRGRGRRTSRRRTTAQQSRSTRTGRGQALYWLDMTGRTPALMTASRSPAFTWVGRTSFARKSPDSRRGRRRHAGEVGF